MKKIISLVLTLVMLVSVFAVLPVAAEDNDVAVENYTIYLDSGVNLIFLMEDGTEKIVPVAAKEMGDEITVGGEGFCVSWAAESFIDSGYSEATEKLAEAILSYGAAAQLYFDHNTDDLVGDPVTDTTALKAAEVDAPTVSDEAGIFIGATLILEGTMKLRFYFAGTEITATVDGEAATATAADGYSYVDVDVMPYNISKAVTVKVGATTVTYAPVNYLKNKADDPTLSTMVASIYAYGVAAEEYVNEVGTDYWYPMNSIVVAEGTIDHSKVKDNAKHKYITDNGEKAAFIDLSEIDYDTVTLTPNANGKTGYAAFLTKMPKQHSEPVNYAMNYNDMIEINGKTTLVIPKNAKYLVVTNNDSSGTPLLPESIVFSDTVTPADMLRDDTLETYEYPMETLSQAQGTISGGAFVSNYWWTSTMISVEDIAFNQVVFEIGDVGSVWYAFLTEYPCVDELVTYAGKATGWSKAEGNPGDTAAADIPRNAVCLVMVWIEKEGDNFVTYTPENITFTKNGTVINPLDDLQDAFEPVYEYPMSEVLPAEGSINYNNGNIYNVSGNRVAFIEITDTVYDIVSLGIDPKAGYVGWAFLTEYPTVGEAVSYCADQHKGHFCWNDLGCDNENIAIPEDAKYLAVWYDDLEDSTRISYCPASITFKQSTYSYPMDTLKPVDGYFANQGNTDSNSAATYKVSTSNENVAFIDLSKLDYNTVTLECHAKDSGWYTFVTKLPTTNNEKINYALNYNQAIWFNPGETVTAIIPDNARYLVVLCNYANKSPTVPQSIVFSNTPNTPSDKLKDDTLTSYEYPMSEIKPSMGTIANDGNKFLQNYRWVGSFVSLEDCAFSKVIFEIGASGTLSYAFLKEYPTVDVAVSFAGGLTKTVLVEEAAGTKVTVDIPADAKYLYIYQHDWGTNAPVYHTPASVTFVNPLRDNSLSEYSYPMDTLTGAEGYIDYEPLVTAEKDCYVTTKGHKVAFIDITNTVFDYVSLTLKTNWVGYTFLTEMPELGEKVSYAGEYKTVKWADNNAAATNIVIPDNAKYLVVWYTDNPNVVYYPASITFHKNEK